MMWLIFPGVMFYSTVAGVVGAILGGDNNDDAVWLGWFWPLVLVYWALLGLWNGGYHLGSLPKEARRRAYVEATDQALRVERAKKRAEQARKRAEELEKTMGRRPDGTYPDPLPSFVLEEGEEILHVGNCGAIPHRREDCEVYLASPPPPIHVKTERLPWPDLESLKSGYRDCYCSYCEADYDSH